MEDIWKAEQFQLGSKTTFYQGLELVDVMSKMQLNRLYNSDIIVDVGSGTGEFTELFSKIFPHKNIYGIDSQESMLEFANNRPVISETINYVYADISQPWEALNQTVRDLYQKVNVVFSNYTLHLVSDKRRAFQNISRLLTTGGHFFVNVPLIPDLNDYFEFSEVEKKQNHQYINSKTKLEQILEYNQMITENGLVILDLKEFLAEWRYDTKEELVGFLEIIPKILATKILKDGIEETEKRDLIRHYSSLYIKAITNKNFQNLPGVINSQEFDLNSFCFTRLRYVCTTAY